MTEPNESPIQERVALGSLLKLEILYPFWALFDITPQTVPLLAALGIAIVSELTELRYWRLHSAKAKVLLLLISAAGNAGAFMIALANGIGLGVLRRGDILEPGYSLHPFIKIWLAFIAYMVIVRLALLFLSWLFSWRHSKAADSNPAQEQVK